MTHSRLHNQWQTRIQRFVKPHLVGSSERGAELSGEKVHKKEHNALKNKFSSFVTCFGRGCGRCWGTGRRGEELRESERKTNRFGERAIVPQRGERKKEQIKVSEE